MSAVRTLVDVMSALRVTQADLVRATGLSRSALSRAVAHGRWPARDAAAAKSAVARQLVRAGATPVHLAVMRAAGLFALPAREHDDAGAVPASTTPAAGGTDEKESEEMLLQNEPLSPAAKKAWGLARSPFADDIGCRDDVWSSASTRYVRAAMMDAAVHHGFIAIIGQSGSGKSTLREELEERITDERRPVIVIKPYTLDMEATEARGKPLRSGRIAEAIGRALAPSLTLRSSPEARFAQVHALLRESCRSGMRHLLVIEEAHRIPLPTLKHLKGWMELKDGLRRLLGVCLIGQDELAEVLSEQRPEVREIVQRCEQIRMLPLDADLESYLAHKFARVAAKASDVLADDAYDALRARLIYLPRGARKDDAISICYPLAVNNCVARAMNAAARAGWPKVDASVIGAI